MNQGVMKPDGGPVQTDVAIIGAGPVGLFAVFACGMVGLRTAVIDALPGLGGQCTALYPEKPIYDIPAHPEITGRGLIGALERQIAPFAPLIRLGERVVALRGAAGDFHLTTDKGAEIAARGVILAAGAGAFGPNRPPLPGLAAFEATGSVLYLVDDPERLRGKRVVIAGGGDSALDWALALRGVAASLTLVHRRGRFRALPAQEEELRRAAARGEIALRVPFQLAALHGASGRLEAVEIASLEGGREFLPADHLLAFFGLAADLGPIAQWGIEREGAQIPVDPARMETSRPGVFAIGDVALYPGKLKLILQGFSEAAVAARALYALIHPDRPLHQAYSTTTGIPPLPPTPFRSETEATA